MKNARPAILSLAVLAVILAPLASRAENEKNNPDDIGTRKVAHRSIISQEKEIGIGKQYSSEIDRSAKLVNDPVLNEYVNRIGQNLARNSDLKIPLTVKIIDSPEINAFTLPGGFLYVNTGILTAADEEDQVAGVLAHEIAHAAARHWASQMTKATLMQYAMIPLLFTPMSYPVYMGVAEAMNFGVPLTFLKFNRSAEAEADFLGLQYMYKAGYDPNAYVSFFGKVMDEERRMPGSVPKLFQDHPPTPDRIVKSEEEIKEILPKKDQYLVSTSEFDDMKARLHTVINTRRKNQKVGPTLKKKEATDKSTTTAQAPPPQGSDSSGSGDDTPPVLKRRDGGNN
jgi:predicted Zn-dependent protease